MFVYQRKVNGRDALIIQNTIEAKPIPGAEIVAVYVDTDGNFTYTTGTVDENGEIIPSGGDDAPVYVYKATCIGLVEGYVTFTLPSDFDIEDVHNKVSNGGLVFLSTVSEYGNIPQFMYCDIYSSTSDTVMFYGIPDIEILDSDIFSYVSFDTHVTRIDKGDTSFAIESKAMYLNKVDTADDSSLTTSRDFYALQIGKSAFKINTYKGFASTWTTDGTTAQFCASVNSYRSAIEGYSFLGTLTCSDLPGELASAQVTVDVLAGTGTSGKTIHLTIITEDSPYRWEYTYKNNGSDVSGWNSFGGTEVIANPTLAGTEADLTGLQVGETKYKVPSGGGGGSSGPACVYDLLTNLQAILPPIMGSNAGNAAPYAIVELDLSMLFDFDGWKSDEGIDNLNIVFGYMLVENSGNTVMRPLVEFNEKNQTDTGLLQHDFDYMFSGYIPFPGSGSSMGHVTKDSRIYLWGSAQDASDACNNGYLFSTTASSFQDAFTVTYDFEEQ